MEMYVWMCDGIWMCSMSASQINTQLNTIDEATECHISTLAMVQ